MVASCCAINCTNRFVKGSGIHLFRFPLKRKELLAKWVKAVKRDKWEPTTTTFICSEHFSESCFRRYSLQLRLKEDAVPTIFDFPSRVQKKVHERQQPPDITQETAISTSTVADFPVFSASSVSEDCETLQDKMHKRRKPLTYEVVPSTSITPDLPTISASYSCSVDDEMLQQKVHMQKTNIKCKVSLPLSVTPDLPTASASSLSEDFRVLERTVENQKPLAMKYLAVPMASATSVKAECPSISGLSHCDDTDEVHMEQSLITYTVIPVTPATTNLPNTSATSLWNESEMRAAQDCITKMHSDDIMGSPHLLKLKYEQLLQHERQRYRELYKRLTVAQRCLKRRKLRMDIMKNTIRQLRLNIQSNNCD